FFQRDHLLNELSMTLELWVRVFHLTNDKIRHLVEERIFETERVMPLIDRPPHDLTQYIIPTFIAGKNSISNREGSSTRMVCDHAHRKTFLRFRFIVSVGKSSSEIDDRPDEICVVI